MTITIRNYITNEELQCYAPYEDDIVIAVINAIERQWDPWRVETNFDAQMTLWGTCEVYSMRGERYYLEQVQDNLFEIHW